MQPLEDRLKHSIFRHFHDPVIVQILSEDERIKSLMVDLEYQCRGELNRLRVTGVQHQGKLEQTEIAR